MGHGIGRRIHEQPDVPNVFDPTLTQPLTDGLVITIEPLVAAGRPDVWMRRDGWTVSTSTARTPATPSTRSSCARAPRSILTV